jgi:hypothetical protein
MGLRENWTDAKRRAEEEPSHVEGWLDAKIGNAQEQADRPQDPEVAARWEARGQRWQDAGHTITRVGVKWTLYVSITLVLLVAFPPLALAWIVLLMLLWWGKRS